VRIVASQGCWPTPVQQLLLRACLAEGEDALEAWREWRKANVIDELDLGSFRLLPLLYHNLHALGVNDPWMGILKGAHRRAWMENQMLFRRAGPVLAGIAAAGIPLLLLKGIPLAHRFYPNPGLRPMRDVDFLVPDSRFLEALALIDPARRRSITVRDWPASGRIPPWRHSMAFRDTDGNEFDIHRHVFWQACYSGADGDFWQSGEPMEFQGIRCLSLCPTDQLLHVCAAGVEWNPVPPVRWIADAVRILRHAPRIDWDRLAGMACRLHVVLPVKEALGYLQRNFEADVPEDVMARLARMPVTPSQEQSHRRFTNPNARRSPRDALLALWGMHLHAFRNRALPVRLGMFPAFLRYHWCMDSLPGIFLPAWQWIWRWVKGARAAALPE
jgi:hypothetical protein